MVQPQNTDGTVGKALDVLDKVASFGRPVRFTEVLADSDHPKATLYRLLQTLTNQRLLAHDPGTQEYSLGVRLVRLAHGAWAQSSLAPLARSYVERLSEETDTTVHLAQLDGGQVLYVDKLNMRQPVQMFSQAGKVGPAYCTGVGKVMLAYLSGAELDSALDRQSYHPYTENTLSSRSALEADLEVIRSRGFAFDLEEHEPTIICVAAPILASNGRVLGAISSTTTTLRGNQTLLEARAPCVVQAAQAIAREAEAWRFPDTSRPLEIAK